MKSMLFLLLSQVGEMKYLVLLLVALLAIGHGVVGSDEPTHEPTHEPTSEPTHEPSMDPDNEIPMDEEGVAIYLGMTGPVHNLPTDYNFTQEEDFQSWYYDLEEEEIVLLDPSLANDTSIDAVLDDGVQDDLLKAPTGFRRFEGIRNFRWPLGGAPPDTVGDIGPNHYVQMVNSRYAIYNRAGRVLEPPRPIGTLFPPGSQCARNDGDPIVLYDQFVDRWLLTQFTTECRQSRTTRCFSCMALSATNNPRGRYHTYQIPAQADPDGAWGSVLPDYPKYGVWSNAYLLTTRDFGSRGYLGVAVYAIQKAPMLSGNTVRWSRWALNIRNYRPNLTGDGQHLLPPDVDGRRPPPLGSPAPIVSGQDNNFGAQFDALNVWNLFVDWRNNPPTRFFLPVQLRTAPFNSNACGFCRSEIPLPGGQRVDSIAHILHRLAYRNFGAYQSMVVVRDVQRAGTGTPYGIRWSEIRRRGATYSLHQEGTYSPNDGVYRWMASIAQDRAGNIAFGYSAANARTFPGIRMAGRLATDPLGRTSFGFTLTDGTGTQNSPVPGNQFADAAATRWGDYSSMNIDPIDDCRFWYTTQYYARSPTGQVRRGVEWQTRVHSFVIPQCLTSPRAGENATTTDGLVVDQDNNESGASVRRRTLKSSNEEEE